MRLHLAPSLVLPVVLLVACELPPLGEPPAGQEGEGEGGGEGEGEGDADLRPVLESVLARAVGRTGADLRIDVTGTDADQDAVGVAVRLLDGAGAERPWFDEDLDGVAESATGFLPFAVALEPAAELSTWVSLPGVLQAEPALAAVEVALTDAQGHESAVQRADLQAQPVRAEGETCDATFVADRCAEDLGCKGEPTTCLPGEAPEITQLAYFEPEDPNVEGPRLVIAGTEPDDDLALFHVETLDAEGAPVLLDSDGDELDDSSLFDIPASGAGGTFAASFPMGLGLHERVARVAVTPQDAAGRQGARVEVALSRAPVRTTGSSCSPQGFDVCASGSVCSTMAGGAYSICQSEAAIRNQQCTSAPVLVLEEGHATFVGTADGASAWDAPSGCAANDPEGRAEAVVLLTLDQPAAQVLITTDTPQTSFDTTLYLLTPCTSAGSTALACADDGEATVASTLELQALPAGTYAIVVDSYSSGGDFGLEVTVQ